jgi:hypothetical protein
MVNRDFLFLAAFFFEPNQRSLPGLEIIFFNAPILPAEPPNPTIACI